MRAALSFLTPFGRASTPGPGTMGWFAFVGAAVGFVVGGTWWAAAHFFPPLVAAVVALAADAVCTGGLHLDGLVDAADGLLPPMPRDRRLEVMRDPAVGAFGAVTLAVVVLLRFAALSATRPAVLVVAGLWGLSRAAMAIVSWTTPYVRADGLASAFGPAGDDEGTATPGPARARLPGPRSGALLGAGFALCVVMALVGRGVHGLVTLAGAALACGAVALLARRRIGGFTGDVLGALGVVGETVGLVVLSAHW